MSTQDSNDARATQEPVFDSMHAADIAAHLSAQSPEDAMAGLDSLPLRRQAATFAYLPAPAQLDLAKLLPRTAFVDIIAEMGSDDRVELFRRLPREQQHAVLQSLSRAQREGLRRLAGHREGTAGAIMTTDFATVSPAASAQEALATLRQEATGKETIYHTYAVDEGGRLVGTLPLQQLILAPPEARVADLLEPDTHAIRADHHQEEAAKRVARYDLLALPVIDDRHRLVGIITHDDALDVLERETTRSFHKSATVTPILDHVRDASVGLLYRRRIVWLIALVFGNLFSGAGIAYFEDVIAAHVGLVFFLPLLIGSGGNAGSQASTLMIRALATGDVVLSDLGRLLGREAVVSCLLGLTMAATVWGLGLVRSGPEIALVVAISMLLVVAIDSLIGTVLPFALSRMGVDTATSSAPMIATIADALGVVIYFAVASALLPMAVP